MEDRVLAAEFREYLARFRRALDTGEVDKDLAWGLLAGLRERCQGAQERKQFDEMLVLLKRKYPELYSGDLASYTQWRVENALLLGELAAIPGLLLELGRNPEVDFDIFFQLIDQLMYHNQPEALIPALRLGWPQVKESELIFSHGVNQYADVLFGLILMAYLERAPRPRADDPVLLAELRTCFSVDVPHLERSVAALTGTLGRSWSRGDFGPDVDGNTWGENVFLLSLEFLGELRRRAGVPYPKGELGRLELYQYLFWRRSGYYQRRLELRGHEQETATSHPLVPEPTSLSLHLEDLMHFIYPRPYRASALMELMPEWVDFLIRRDLLSAAEADPVRRGLHPLAEELASAIESYGFGPLLAAPGSVHRVGENSNSNLVP